MTQYTSKPSASSIAYRTGVSGWPSAVVRGTGIRVQTLALAVQTWGLSAEEISDEYDLTIAQVKQALRFYEAHRDEIDREIEAETELEAASD